MQLCICSYIVIIYICICSYIVIIYIYICSYIVIIYICNYAYVVILLSSTYAYVVILFPVIRFILPISSTIIYMFKIIIIIKKIILTNYISYCSFSSFPFPVSFHYLIYCNLFIIFPVLITVSSY